MGDAKLKLAFWLLPAGDSRPFFAAVIEDLAHGLEAPVFEPHVTLNGGELDANRALELLEEAAASVAPLQLQIAGVEFSDKYTKTLYVQFRASAAASALSTMIGRGIGGANGYSFDPHLSLLYKTMPRAAKQELARQIKIPFDVVTCDALKLVRVPAAIQTGEDVEAWRMLSERQLAGPR